MPSLATFNISSPKASPFLSLTSLRFLPSSVGWTVRLPSLALADVKIAIYCAAFSFFASI